MNRTQKNETTIYSNAYAKELDDVLVHYLPDSEMAIIIRSETSAQFAVYTAADNGYIAARRYFWKNQNARDAGTFTLCFAPPPRHLLRACRVRLHPRRRFDRPPMLGARQ